MTLWKNKLLVGVPHIDTQHRKLVKALDRLLLACKQGKGRSTIEQTLNFAFSYTKEHFKDEEILQTQYAYPDIQAHKQLHAQFLATISALIQEFEQTGPNLALTGKLNKTLVNWLIHHISVEDKKLGAHIQQASEK